MKNHSIIRTIYLYLFALLGLVLIIIGGVQFIDMGLKTFVFTKADEEQKLSYSIYDQMPYPLERITKLTDNGIKTDQLTEEEKTTIKEWLADYKERQTLKKNMDPVISRRQKSASISLAMILIGLPLYLFHWSTIIKDAKNNKKES